jgi:DNA polymerase
MTPGDRKRMLDALGFVDWRPRPDRIHASTGSVADEPAVAAAADVVTDEQAMERSPVPPSVEQGEAAPAQADASLDEAPAAFASARAEASDAVAEHDQRDEPADPVPEPPVEPSTHGQPGDVSRMDWDELEAWLATCDHRGASRPVFGIGARDADVLIVGEAPGANEDAQGVPFVGRAGKLLDRMLFAIGCSRETNVYITNICKFRPPNNRDPNAEEVAADWPVLERQIELMDPKLVVAVGRVAAQTLLDSKQSLGKMRGTLHRHPRRELDVLVTYHPAFLLRSPGQKAKAWIDLKQIARRIAQA